MSEAEPDCDAPLQRLPLPLRVHGPRAWYRMHLRPGQEVQLASSAGEVFARVRAEGIDGGKLLGLIPIHNGTRLILESWAGEDSWQPLWQASQDALDSAHLTRLHPASEHSASALPQPGHVHFNGIKAELRNTATAGSVDRPDPLRAGWRFWEAGAARAETELQGQREIPLLPLDESTELAVELFLAWLIGMNLAESVND